MRVVSGQWSPPPKVGQGWGRGQGSREPVLGDRALIYPEPANQDRGI